MRSAPAPRRCVACPLSTSKVETRPLVDAEPGAGIALRIEIDDQHALADGGERRAEIDGRGRLADAALLVGEREDAHAPWPERVHGALTFRAARSSVTSTICDVRRGQARMQARLAKSQARPRRLDLGLCFATFQEQPPGLWPEERAASSKRRGSGASARALTTSGSRLWALSARSSMRIA